MNKKKLIKQSEFAKQMGITRQGVSWLVKKGIIPVTKDGLIDPISFFIDRDEYEDYAVPVSLS